MEALRRFRACAVVFSMLFTVLWHQPAAAQSYRWGTVRIGGGGYVTGIVASGDKLYARTDVGGAYRWSGSEWIPLLDHLNPDQDRYFGVDGMAVDPNDNNVLYVAVGKYTNSTGDVWRSGDGGTTWTSLGLNKPYGGNEGSRWLGECLAVDPNNSGILYAGTRTDGLWRRSSGTWSKITSVPNGPSNVGVRSVVIDKATARVYAGVRGSGVYVSTNGTSFSLISGSPTNPARLAVNGSTLYVTSDVGVHKYNGSSWSTISPNGSRNYCALAVDPTNANNVAAAEYYFGFGCPIYYSTNGGSSWSNKTNGTKNNNVPWYPSGWFSAATSSLVLNPLNPKEIWFADWYQVWKAGDVTVANPTWNSQPWGHEELVTFDIACPPSGAFILNGCADNGGLRHTNITQYPTVKFGSQESTGIDFCEANPNYAARVSSDGWGGSGYKFSVSTDQGLSWQTRTNPGNNGRLAYSATNTSRIVWIPSNSGTPKYTSDGGWTWANTSGTPSVGTGGFWGWHKPLASDRVNGTKLYIFSGGTLYRSTNSGVNFSAAATGLPSHSGTGWTYLKAAPGREGELLLSLGNNGLYRSSNSGSNFTKISFFSRSALAAYGPPMSGSSSPTIFVLGVANSTWGVYRSTDLGATWTRINDDTFQCGDSPNCIEGDRQVSGRVYIGSNGRGLYFLEPGSSTSQVAPPTFNPAAGTYTSAQSVTISTTTSGASIRYTTDGSTPSSTTGTVYSGPVSISSTTTLKAIAYKSGMIDSSVTSGTYTINLPAAIASGTATIDATVDSAWGNATAYSISNVTGTISSTSDLSGTWKGLWDSTNLYLLADVTDDDKRNDSTNPWEDDSVELYVDGNNDKATSYDSNDRQYVFGWGDTAVVEAGGRSTTGVTFAKADPTSTSYRIEAKVPWGTLGVTASSGKNVGLDVHINDDDAGGAREGKRQWNDTADTAWQNPSVFGNATLQSGGSPPAAPTGLTATAGDAQVSLSWTASSGATSYNVKRSTTSGSGSSTVGTSTDTTHTDSGLTNGTTYYYVVSAVNSNGESGNSNQDSATPTAPSGQGTFGNGGNPWSISSSGTTRVEAENYDTGGQGVAYDDLDTTNNGGAYRTGEGVDVQATTDTGGGYNVGWVNAGEWIEHTVNVAAAGTYDIKLRVARQPTGTSTVRVLFDGVDKTGSMSVPSTGAWQSFTTITASGVSLSAGQQVMRIDMTGSSYNLNWVEFTPSGGSGNTHGGTWAAKGTLTESWTSIWQQANVSDNQTYTASFWLKGSGQVTARVHSAFWGTEIVRVSFNATSTWTLCSFTYNTGTSGANVLNINDTGSGTCYVDDCFMGPGGGTNALANPGFESGTGSWNVGTAWTILQNP